jgi:hypothetical protein
VCSPASQTCELRALDAGDPDATIDASSDGALPDAPPNAPALQQQITNYAATAASLSATLPAAPTSGRVLVMIGATPSGGLTSVTGGGASWTLATRSLTNANIELWYGVSDGSSATVTIARTNNTSNMWLVVSEWSGLTTPVVLDGAISTFGTTSPASAGSISTTGATLVLFAAANGGSNTFGAPTPGTWTAMTGITGVNMQNEWYRVAPSPGTFAPAVTETANAWDAAIAAFRFEP